MTMKNEFIRIFRLIQSDPDEETPAWYIAECLRMPLMEVYGYLGVMEDAGLLMSDKSNEPGAVRHWRVRGV